LTTILICQRGVEEELWPLIDIAATVSPLQLKWGTQKNNNTIRGKNAKALMKWIPKAPSMGSRRLPFFLARGEGSTGAYTKQQTREII